MKEDSKHNIPLVVHWEGKIVCDILGKKDIDRLPIVVSGVGAEQLLSVPKLLEGTGQRIATSVDCTIHEWNLKDQVKGMCFDTTSSNTGCKNGACVLLEQKLVSIYCT